MSFSNRETTRKSSVPDTVGYTTPREFMELIQGIRANVPGVDKCTISVHGHDDLGMAVANFLSAIEGGARQVALLSPFFLPFLFFCASFQDCKYVLRLSARLTASASEQETPRWKRL